MANVQDYLLKLLEKAQEHLGAWGVWETVSNLYRNKSSDYFDDIQNNNNNLMVKYIKDNGGDPRCPMNGRLEGLFFGVTLRDGALPLKSPFGDTRVILPLSSVFDDSAKLYFADFFCMPTGAGTHYVILVITKDGSESDRFCEQELIQLDPQNNSFLTRQGDRYKAISRQRLWLEVFYTEDVDISSLVRTRTGVLGQGHSSGGIGKDPRCRVCNVETQTRNADLHGLGAICDLMMRPQEAPYRGGQMRPQEALYRGSQIMRPSRGPISGRSDETSRGPVSGRSDNETSRGPVSGRSGNETSRAPVSGRSDNETSRGPVSERSDVEGYWSKRKCMAGGGNSLQC